MDNDIVYKIKRDLRGYPVGVKPYYNHKFNIN